MPHSRTRVAGWMLGCVLSRRDVEATIGDLEEEYLLRSRSTGDPAVFRWYWSQIARTIPLLVWTSVRRGGWAMLAVALGACIVQAAVELASKFALSSLSAADTRLPAFLTLIIGLPSLVFVSYLAARIRPGAATAMAGLILIAVAIQIVVKPGGDLPYWNQMAALLVGPSAAFAGGILSLRTRT